MYTELINRINSGFYKVKQTGGCYVVATFFNPATHETIEKCVRDYEYSDCSRDIDELYYMPITDDESVLKAYKHYLGFICVGDTVEVIKGRKVPIGTIARVVKIKPYYDMYGRHCADYLYFDNGMRTNINNCVLTVN